MVVFPESLMIDLFVPDIVRQLLWAREDETYRCFVLRSSRLVQRRWIIRIIGMGLASKAPVAQLRHRIKRNPTLPVLYTQED